MKNTIETKVCTKCGEDKPLSEYHKNKQGKYGRRSKCKECMNSVPLHNCDDAGCDQLSKVCTECGEDKPLSEYPKRKGAKDGHRNDCKACKSAYKKAYNEANRERIAAQKKAYNEANRHEIAAHQKAYREANREGISAWKKAYHAEKWANDPEYRAQFAAAEIRRRRLLASAKQEPYLRKDIFERDNWTCGICQEPIDSELRHPDSGSASIDHVIPISLGGDDTPANVQAAHFGCNSAKGNRVELEDLEVAA